MQTFLPYPDFEDSVAVLDNKRLGKQRVEAKQLLDILRGKTKAWSNHPACKMWVGYDTGLAFYLNLCIAEWVRRGFNNTMEYEDGFLDNYDYPEHYPFWLENPDFHKTHRARLLEKDFEHYRQYFQRDDFKFNQGLYIWPVMETKSFEIIIPKKERHLIDKSKLLNYPVR